MYLSFTWRTVVFNCVAWPTPAPLPDTIQKFRHLELVFQDHSKLNLSVQLGCIYHFLLMSNSIACPKSFPVPDGAS